MKIALICPKYFSPEEIWGETIEFMQLQSVLKRMGHHVRLLDLTNAHAAIYRTWDLIISNWNSPLFDQMLYEDPYSCPTFFWVMSSPINMQRFWDEHFSNPYDAFLTTEPNSDLPNSYHVECGTDTTHYGYKPNDDYHAEYLYLGNYDKRKDISTLKDRTHVYGSGWNNCITSKVLYLHGKYVPYELTPTVYSSAKHIYCLHNEDMVRRKMIQGRVYDVLACGHTKEDIITNQDISRVDEDELDYEFRVEQIMHILDEKNWRR